MNWAVEFSRSVSEKSLRRARLVFLLSLLASCIYYVTWYYWRWSNLPALIIMLFGLPWSVIWMFCNLEVVAFVPASLKYIANVLALSLMFAGNCGAAYLAWSVFRSRKSHA